ncbi:O-antigen ligase family protein [uncultured Clostridium sp.]|uniref:O-antigen ligase family protein n=1 Tax=uncultured Clostridium sp. TaxID=59620 RepID=UPI002630007A|nr:O-antigen ligase family protein [uncultured Clostridium sp.]
MEIREKIISILEYLLAICIIINANTIWNFMNLNVSQNLWIYTLIVLWVLVILSIKEICKNKKRLFILGIVLISVTLYNSIFIMVNGMDKGDFIIGFLGLLLGVILYTSGRINKKKRYSLILKVSNVMVILALISLYYYVKVIILKDMKPTSEIVFTWGGAREIPNYNNLYYITQYIDIGNHIFARNTGIFTEGPMYAFPLSIALIAELFFRKTKGWLNKVIIIVSTVILVVTIMTTLSTTAIGIMAAAIPLRILSFIVSSIRRKSKIKIAIGIVLLIVFATVGIMVGGFFLKNKVKNSADNQYGSYSVRKDDFKVGYETWKKNKIIGCGFNQYQYVQANMNFIGRGNDIGGSSGLMKVLPEGGLMLFMVYLIPFILAMLYGIKKRNLNVIFAYILIYIIFAVTAIQYRFLMIYFLGLGFSYSLNLLDKRKKKLKEE